MKQPIQHVSHFPRLSQHFVGAQNTTDVTLTFNKSILVTLLLCNFPAVRDSCADTLGVRKDGLREGDHCPTSVSVRHSQMCPNYSIIILSTTLAGTIRIIPHSVRLEAPTGSGKLLEHRWPLIAGIS